MLAREAADDDTDFLVNLTNDGWFGESAAQWQHAAAALFRAVENGLPLIRCCEQRAHRLGGRAWPLAPGLPRRPGHDLWPGLHDGGNPAAGAGRGTPADLLPPARGLVWMGVRSSCEPNAGAADRSVAPAGPQARVAVEGRPRTSSFCPHFSGKKMGSGKCVQNKPALAQGAGRVAKGFAGGYLAAPANTSLGLVVPASAPGSGTTGESMPIFAQRKYTTAPTTNASTGAAGTLTPRLGRMPTTKPAAQAIQPAGLKPARGPRPLPAVEQVIHHHRAADRTERGADDREHRDGASPP